MLEDAITRRGFVLAATAAGAAAVGVSSLGAGGAIKAAHAAGDEYSADIVHTMCDGCGNTCGMNVYVKDGYLWKFEGNPDHPYVKGTLCGRGQAYPAIMHSAARVETPLRRGEGGAFEAVSWDDALADIASRILGTSPEKVAMFQDGRGTHDYFTQRFMSALGSPNYFTDSVLNDMDILSAINTAMGVYPSPDAGESKYIVFLDKSYYEGIRPAEANEILHMRANGGHTVVVDPRACDFAGIADEWVPVRAGTELAFLLGVMGYIAANKGYDADFGHANGLGFDEFVEAATQFTPEWASEKTGIPAEKIAEIAQGLIDAAPHCYIDMQWAGSVGSGYRNSLQTLRTLLLTNAMLGNINQPGGLIVPVSPQLPEDALDPAVFVPTGWVTAPRLGDGDHPLAYPYIGNCQAALGCAQDGSIDVALFVESNPMRDYSDTAQVQRDLDAIPFKVAVNSVMNETAAACDYVLPSLTYLESEGIVDVATAKHTVANIRTRVAQPVFPECKAVADIMRELGNACGLNEYFTFTLEDYNRALCDGYGISYEELKSVGVIPMEGAELEYGSTPYIMTPSGKIEFTCQAYADAGYGLTPEWVDTEVEGSVEQPRLILGDQSFQVRSYTEAADKVSAMARDNREDRLWVHPQTAAAAGIADGDTVEVTSQVGSVQATARVTERIHPEAVYLPPHYGCRLEDMGEANGLGGVARTLVPRAEEPATGAAMNHEVTVTLKKVSA